MKPGPTIELDEPSGRGQASLSPAGRHRASPRLSLGRLGRFLGAALPPQVTLALQPANQVVAKPCVLVEEAGRRLCIPPARYGGGAGSELKRPKGASN
jgi:hypothetical protein